MEEGRSDVHVPVPEREHGSFPWTLGELQTPSPPTPTDLPRPVSAPPDLEMPEPVLLATSGIQPNWFAVVDIRADADYESFYDAFKEQTKLPPPLDSSVLRGDFDALRIGEGRSRVELETFLHSRASDDQQARLGHESEGVAPTTLTSQAEPLKTHERSTFYPGLVGSVAGEQRHPSSAGGHPRPEALSPGQRKLVRPTVTAAMGGLSIAGEPHRSIANAGTPLRRDDSDASVENLIFRETLKYARQLDRDSSESDLSTTAERRGIAPAPPVVVATGLSEADRRLWQAPLVAGEMTHLPGSMISDPRMSASIPSTPVGDSPHGGGNGVDATGIRDQHGLAPKSSGTGIRFGDESAPRPFSETISVTASAVPPVTMPMNDAAAAQLQMPRIAGAAPAVTMEGSIPSVTMPSWSETAAPLPSAIYNGPFYMGNISAALPQQRVGNTSRRASSARSRARREMRYMTQNTYSSSQHPAGPTTPVYLRPNEPTVRSSLSSPYQTRYGNHELSQPVATIPMEYNGVVDEAAPLSSFAGNIAGMARDQHGGRFLQARLDAKNTADIALVFTECLPHFVDLMMDPFGNYLCQKLFEHCDQMQRLELIRQSAAQLAQVSLNPHGTRVVQKMVELTHEPDHATLLSQAIAPHCLSLMCDVNGNHVIQRCLQRMDATQRQFIFQTVLAHCLQVAKHRHGCCVLQRCLDHADEEQRAQICSQILSRARDLMQDPFGNYVVQYVLELKEPNYTHSIIQQIRGHLWHLSMQKFSSNVVEKVFSLADEADLRLLLHELLEGAHTHEPGTLLIGSEQHQRNIRPLLFDPYANYVVQRALSLANSPEFEALREAIQPHLMELRGTPFGKRIQARLVRPGMRPSVSMQSAETVSRPVPEVTAAPGMNTA
jgi:hypothetical protein